MQGMRRLILIAGTLWVSFVLLSGCSSRSVPAPLVLLNSQTTDSESKFSSSTYTVEKGDTLFAIAWFSGNDYRDIARYNNLKKPYTIFPGQVLKLSASTVSVNTKPSKTKASRPTGPTSKNNSKKPVDQQKEQAYGESEKNVNNQPVKPVKVTATKTFPARVGRWVWPAKGKLIGTFSRDESGNKGIDIQAPRGTKVFAAASGKVVYSGSALRGYGKLVIIKHTDTFLSAYAHNDSIMVKEQQWVEAGQQIASMGNSGTDSVRLHFEVRYRGKSLDPLRYLPSKQ